ncbi:hypothetical protein Ato02nite_051870 [Paractinoplanes toevensis]|uniref:G domain-containing protein n=2 Tax=Paractinoplanes toevensis TaxID=571911 RepID=A0A919W414_9ACTN|nr:hypothetical protein Ato02nite_051870 [Actinoplanes toevensis]
MNAFREGVRQDSSIDPSSKETLLREVDNAYDQEPSPVLAFIGETGVGKSTTVNSLFNAGQEVGHFKPTTLTVDGLQVYATVDHVQGSRGDLRVIDMPGLGDDIENYEAYLRLYLETLPKADAILWVHPASDRMVAFTQQVLRELVTRAPDLRSRIVFGLNKADEMYPGDWNPRANTPSDAQLRYLELRVDEFADSVKPHLKVKKPAIVPYSALRRYNLATLFRILMEAVPKQRRWVLESRMDLADFIALVDRGMVKIAQDTRQAIPPRVPPQANRSEQRPATFDEYLDSLSEAQYGALVADRARFRQLRDGWGKNA